MILNQTDRIPEYRKRKVKTIGNRCKVSKREISGFDHFAFQYFQFDPIKFRYLEDSILKISTTFVTRKKNVLLRCFQKLYLRFIYTLQKTKCTSKLFIN